MQMDPSAPLVPNTNATIISIVIATLSFIITVLNEFMPIVPKAEKGVVTQSLVWMGAMKSAVQPASEPTVTTVDPDQATL